MLRRIVLSAVVVSAGLLASVGVASAHIDPDPTQAQAGSRLTVGFTVEHGCEGSPTVQLDMRLPEGATDPVAEDIDGWDGSVDTIEGDTIVTFAGGPLADDVEGTFFVTLTLPPTPDTTIYFPFVQRCEAGEIRWIGIPTEPDDELDEPAPAMQLTGPVASPETIVTDPPSTTTTEPSPETAVTDPPSTTEPSPDTSAASVTSAPVTISEAGDTDSSRSGTVVFIASIAAVLGLGGFVAFRSRQARAGISSDAS